MINTELGKSWIEVNQDELIVKDWKEIRDDLINVFGEIYKYPQLNGKYQIPTNSSDFILISNLALAYWNMSRNIRTIYDQHSLSRASGNFLDKIMSYYGVYRKVSKKYIIQVKLHGGNIGNGEMRFDNFYDWRDLYSEKYPEIKFQYLNEVEKGDNFVKYNVVATDVLSIGVEELRRLNLISINGEVSNLINKEDENTFNKIIVLQKERESDDEFRMRIQSNSDYKRLYDELEKNQYVEKFLLVDGSSIIPSIQKTPLISNFGEVGVFVELKEWALNDTNINSIKSDVISLIAEFLPLGMVTNHITNNKIYGLDKDEVDTPVNDIVNQRIKIHFMKPVQGALVFKITEELDKKLLEDRIETLMGWLNNLEIFENYQRNDVIYLMEKLFRVEWLSIKYFIKNTDKTIEVSDDWIENNQSGIKFYTPQISYQGELDQPALKLLLEENEDISRSLKFTKFKTKQNEDKSINVVIY